jgi:hypothetical protein
MKESIINSLDSPAQLEKLYRDNKRNFKQQFNLIYADIRSNAVAQAWNERLNYESEEISLVNAKELPFVLAVCFIAGLLAKLPDLIGLNQEIYYTRNAGLILFPMLTAYFAWKQKVELHKILFIAAAFIISGIYINLLPNGKSDTLILACIHLPLFLWTVFGYAFTEGKSKIPRRLDFLKYNGDLIVMTGLILIAGAMLAVVSFNLFELIGINIGKFYGQYVIIWGLPSAPIIGTYLVQTNPQIVNKVSPVIAKLFTPLVLVTLVIYLIAIAVTGKDPYNDREFLLIFNVLLVGVMAIVFFSIAEATKNQEGKISLFLLFALSIVTVLANGVALSAIVFRISTWGITPNRLAVLGGNLLFLTNLLMVTFRLYKTLKDSNEIEGVEKAIAAFLPVYCIWTLIVSFLFPVIFSFR